MSELPSQPNRSLIDGLAVLQAVASGREPVSSKALAGELALEPTRANRLLKTLAHVGLVHRTSDRRYAPGPGMHVLAAQALFASGLVQRALGPLEDLSRLRLTVAMGVLWRDSVAYLYHWQPGKDFAEALGRTALYPATRSGIGMALLAAKPEAEVRALYRGREVHGYSGVRALVADLRETRERGYALVRQARGAKGLGVSLGSPAYAAVALSGRLIGPAMREGVTALRETARRIEERERT
jgi:DNA-binding IclR family transcriptional regulator